MTEYRIIKTDPFLNVTFSLVTGKKIVIPEINSKWSFFITEDKMITNIETGFRCGIQSYFMDKIEMLEKMLNERLEYFGNVKDIPEDGKEFPSWYHYYAKNFRNTFGFDMPVDWSGLNVAKFDNIIKPRLNESTYQAVERLYGLDTVEFLKDIVDHPPFCQWFWRCCKK